MTEMLQKDILPLRFPSRSQTWTAMLIKAVLLTIWFSLASSFMVIALMNDNFLAYLLNERKQSSSSTYTSSTRKTESRTGSKVLIPSKLPASHSSVSPTIQASLDSESTKVLNISHPIEVKPPTFIDRLVSFVSISGFDHIRFEQDMGTFCKELTEAIDKARESSLSKTENSHLKYALEIFQKMRVAALQMKIYHGDDTASHLVRCVIQLNLMLFHMFDESGDPDPGAEEFAKTIARLLDVMNVWRSRFEVLGNDSLDVHAMFISSTTLRKILLKHLVKFSNFL